MNSIAIVIVNYNTCEHLQRCLASICEDEEVEIIVVDNGSSDGSVEMVRRSFPKVTLYADRLNLGYGTAANDGIRQCQVDAVFLLNSDTLLQKGSARKLLDYLDCHPQAAIAGPRLHNLDGSLQPSCYGEPSPLNRFLEESSIGRWCAYLPVMRSHYLRTWRHDRPRVVPWLLGAALAIRRDAFLAMQGFDPDFFMYFEEVDLCRRLRDRGWQIHFAPVTDIIHCGGASTSQSSAKMLERFQASEQRYYRRYFGDRQLQLLRLAMIPVVAARLMRDAARYRLASRTEVRARAKANIQLQRQVLRHYLAPSCTLPAASTEPQKANRQ